LRLALFVRATSWSLVGVILSTLLGLFVTSRVIHTLGSESWGAWAMSLQVVAYLSLAELGVLSLVPRDLAAARGMARPPEEMAALLASATRSAILQAVLAALAFDAWLLWARPAWVPQVAVVPLAIAGNASVLSMPLRLSAQALAGYFDVDFVALLGSGTMLFNAMASLLVVLAGGGLSGLAIVWGATQVGAGVAGLARLQRLSPVLVPSLSAIWKARGAVSSRNGWLVIGQISHVVLNATDTLLIGRALGAAQVATYTCTDRALTVTATLPGSASQAAGPFLAEAASRDPVRGGRAALGLLVLVLCMSVWIAASVVAANAAFVKLWVGPAQYGGSALNVALAVAFVVAQLSGALVQVVFFLGDVRTGTLTGVASSVLFLVLCQLLLPRMGSVAAPASLAVSVALTAVPFLLASTWTRTRGLEGRAGVLLGWAVRFFVLLVLSSVIGAHWSSRSLWDFLLAVALATLASVVLFGGYLYREPLRSLVLTRLVERGSSRWLGPVLLKLEWPALLLHRIL
jgi:O-antigen/teichoic acid export membrane protein